jgi:UDP-N-acetylmuramoyl-L-alanyl-D-glutamate--2,6-diaminopimelate ligase
MKKLVPQKIKNIYHLFQAILANLIYGFPSRNIKVIGVTGTNGKTTVCQMIAKILEEAGHKVAMITTINFKIGGKEWVNKTKFTTLSSFITQKFIKQSVDGGCEYLVLETSSHSLDQNRTWGINFDVAVITNVTREHLDYHKTMEKYREAKLKLFKNVRTAVVNLDMERPEEFLSCNSKLKFGFTTLISNFKFQISNQIQNSNDQIKIVKAESIEVGENYTKYQILDTKYQLHLPGKFNIENALAATCVGLSQNISLEIISKALEKIKCIPGRMEYVPNNKGLNIIIDYAVTPDSLEKLYTLVRQINANRTKVVSVFGSCGERDRGKRPMMGEIVAKYADYIILTNEDPYGEDPWQIINEVAAGIKNKEENVNFWKIMDRREAIKKALQIAKPGDYVIVTGKGAEEIMAVGKKRISWNDKKVILEELQQE